MEWLDCFWAFVDGLTIDKGLRDGFVMAVVIKVFFTGGGIWLADKLNPDNKSSGKPIK